MADSGHFGAGDITRPAALNSFARVWRLCPDMRLGQLLAFSETLAEDHKPTPDNAFSESDMIAGLAAYAVDLEALRRDNLRPDRAAEQSRLVELLVGLDKHADAGLSDLVLVVGRLCDRHTDQHITIIDDELELVLQLELARLNRKSRDAIAHITAEKNYRVNLAFSNSLSFRT